MKILLVSDYDSPRGGNEVVTLLLRDGLRRRGHDARLFSSRARSAREERGAADYHCFGSSSRLRAALWCGNPSAYLSLRRALDDFRPDVVHVRLFLSQLSPLILPLLRDVPAIFHDGWYRTVCPVGSKVLPDGQRCLDRVGTVCFRQGCVPVAVWPLAMGQLALWRRWRAVFDEVVAVSDSVARHLAESGIEHVTVVRNGVVARPARPPLSEPPTAVFAGRLEPEKGADLLIRAFVNVLDHLPQARLLIAGVGSEEARLRELAAPRGASIEFLGQVPRAAIERRFDQAWAQVVPSRGLEAFGNAAAEAMMRGTAVIASSVEGMAEYLDHQHTALLFPPEDQAALAARLLQVLSDRNRAEELGRAGREHALEVFDVDDFLGRFEAIYESVVARYAATTRTGL